MVFLVIGVTSSFFFCLGAGLAVVGLAFLIIGLAQEEKPSPTGQYVYGYARGYPTYDQTQYAAGQALMPMSCPKCRAPLPPGSAFCSACGNTLDAGLPKCARCSLANQPGARSCRQCGEPLAPRDQKPRPLSYTDMPVNVLVVCPKCGQSDVRSDKYCHKCDADLTETKKALAERTTRAKFK